MMVQILDNCLYYQPSVLFLDDLDIICGEPIETGEGILSSEANYFNRYVSKFQFNNLSLVTPSSRRTEHSTQDFAKTKNTLGIFES